MYAQEKQQMRVPDHPQLQVSTGVTFLPIRGMDEYTMFSKWAGKEVITDSTGSQGLPFNQQAHSTVQ